MRSKIMTALFALGLWPAAAAAQDPAPPRGEVYTGVAYASLSVPGLDSRRHSGGWGASVTGNLNRHFGLTLDFAGQYDPKCAETDIECILRPLLTKRIVSYSSHQFLAGPRVRFPGRRFDLFFHALVGGARTRSTTLDLNTGQKTEVVSGPNLALGFGGGVDWKFAERAGARLLQVDYIPVRDARAWRHNVRIQGGIFFRF